MNRKKLGKVMTMNKVPKINENLLRILIATSLSPGDRKKTKS